MKTNIRLIYLYLVSLIALIIIVVSAGSLINLALKTWILKDADKNNYSYRTLPPEPKSYVGVGSNNEDIAKALAANPNLSTEQKIQIDNWLVDYKNWQEQDNDPDEMLRAQRQSSAAHAIAYLLIASPVFWFHWRWAQKEREERNA